MRAAFLIPVLVVAACGGGGGEQKNAARPKAPSLAAGQWELTSEVTALDSLDQGSPRIDTPVGTRATESVCVGAGRPPTAFFAGEGYRCSYDNYYVRGGRANVTMRCSREGLSGQIAIMADGRFEADSIEYDREIRTVLSTDGDVRVAARVTGRRTGACAAEAEAGNSAG